MGKSARVDVTDATVNGANPMLLSIVVSVGLATPTSSVGKVKLGGVTADTATLFDSVLRHRRVRQTQIPYPRSRRAQNDLVVIAHVEEPVDAIVLGVRDVNQSIRIHKNPRRRFHTIDVEQVVHVERNLIRS